MTLPLEDEVAVDLVGDDREPAREAELRQTLELRAPPDASDRVVGAAEQEEARPRRERARVALSDGATFGRGGAGFVRLNFGCPRSLLTEGLDRMRDALAAGRR